jgi:hypothetical protein
MRGYAKKTPLLTQTFREQGEDEWSYQIRAERAEERAEWKLTWLGVAMAAALYGLWQIDRRALVEVAIFAFAVWLVFTEDPVRHKQAVCVGRGLLLPLVVMILLVVNVGYNPAG